MKKIDIQITKAEISSFAVVLKDGMPDVSATINCYTEAGKKITDFSVTTQDYYSGVKFELPMGMIQPIVDIAKRLEDIVIQETNKELCLLPKQGDVK